MSRNLIDTDKYSVALRQRMIDRELRAISLTNFGISEQAADFRQPPNCNGFGRLHTFEVEAFADWPSNPLPVRPATKALGLPRLSSLPAQVFQNSGCNWRCWYCFVPFEDLTTKRGQFVRIEDLVDWALEANPERHLVDLSGGQPDLTPEWSVWYLEELDRRAVHRAYVWSDDNLSTDYLWRYLSDSQIAYLGEHPLYGRACCLKGFSPASFTFNTRAKAEMFERQLGLLARLRNETAIDYFVYVTVTTPTTSDLKVDIARFVDRLQAISEYLPLRCVPLKILEWGPVTARLDEQTTRAMENQFDALDAWSSELAKRFPGTRPEIEDVPR